MKTELLPSFSWCLNNSTLADSYILILGCEVLVKLPSWLLQEKWKNTSVCYLPICSNRLLFENLGSANSSAHDFVKELRRRTFVMTGDPQETSFLHQSLSVTLHRFNSVFSVGDLLPHGPMMHPTGVAIPKCFYHLNI